MGGFVLALVLIAIYLPALHGEFLWDDELLILRNRLNLDPSGWWKIWFEPRYLIDYFPLSAEGEWIQWQFFHTNTFGYHLVNVVLQFVSALLVWKLFARLHLRLAWLGALLFAVHPVTVESVAWMAELKNTLSLPLFLAAMLAWIAWDRDRRRIDYLRALVLFLAAMLAKPSAVMFPFVILLYAWWRHGRVRAGDLAAAAPFFLVSLVLGLITIRYMHPAYGLKTIELGGPLDRLAIAGTTLAFYTGNILWPVGLLPVYPKWTIDPPSAWLAWLALVTVLAVCWWGRKRWGRHALLGLGFFLLNLVPFLGFTPTAYMSFAWAMDHVLYLPMLGLIGLATAGLGALLNRAPAAARTWMLAGVVAVLAALAVGSRAYAAIFQTQEALWTYTLRGNPGLAAGHNNLALYYFDHRRNDEAMAEYRAAIHVKPDFDEAYNGLGNTFFYAHDINDAMEAYRAAIRLKPDSAEAHNGLANALLAQGDLDGARAECERALAVDANYTDAHCNLGLIAARQGHFDAAISEFEQAHKINPLDGRIPPIIDQLRAQAAAAAH
jgi:Tfp pilus assembly protein PilF